MQRQRTNDLGWVLSTNFAEGLPYAVITTLSVVMMADMGLSNTEVTAWTSLLAMPWSLKALWSPVVGYRPGPHTAQQGLKTWLWATQALLAVTTGGLALSLLSAHWLLWCLVALTVGAFTSATYDVACDGYYMAALDKERQAFFVGIRSTAYRLSMIFASGVLTTFVGLLARRNGGDLASAWRWVMVGVALLLAVFALCHHLWLPEGRKADEPLLTGSEATGDASDVDAATSRGEVFLSFVRKPGLWFVLLFLLFYRLGEALLSKMTILFLKAPVAEGGLGLDNAEYGLLYGTIGVGALTVGGIVGGMLVSRYGLPRMVVPLALALNVPDLLYVWMSVTQPESRWLIGTLVGIEQLGYGLGFTAYMVFMLQSAQGRFATAHYAFLTALMAVGMNLPSMLSGWLQERLGYTSFFWVAVACTVPGILLSVMLRQRLIRSRNS